MKKIYLLIALLTLGVVGVCFAVINVQHPMMSAQKNTVKNADNMNAVVSKTHPTLTIQLPSNPSTGYSWFIKSYNHDLLTLKSHQYIHPKKPMPGAGGQEQWVFQATPSALIGSHVTKIQLLYARPWLLQKGVDASQVKTIVVITTD